MLLKSLKTLIVIIVSIYSFGLFAQGIEQTYKIAGITVEGSQYTNDQTILSLSGLHVGDQISLPADNKVQTAIKNLWNRKQFSDVDIVVDRITPVGIFLIIEIKEFDRLSYINIQNNEEVKTDDIKKAIGKSRGDIINKYDLYLSKQKIKALYEEEGLAFAKIEMELVASDTANFSILEIFIEEGIEFHVNSIKFEGNSAFDDSDLASEFDETHTASWWEIWKSSKFDKNEYEADKKLLRMHYLRNGYIDYRLVSDTIIYNEDDESVDIVVTLDEGNKVYVRDIIFKGNTVFKEEPLLKRLEFEKGEEYNVEKFDMNLTGNQEFTDALSLYANAGYLAANMDKTEMRVARDTVDIIVNVYENSRFMINKIDIAGNTKTKDKVIRRELYTRPGDYFDRSALVRSIRALGVLNYFNQETLQPQIKQTNDNTAVDIVYNVEERSTDTFNASIGFAGSFGLTGSVGITLNNFSIAEPLRGGGGQLLNFNWEIGQWTRIRRFAIGYSEPWLFDEPTTVGFNLYDTHIDYFYELNSTGASVNLGRRFKWPDDYFRADWGLRYEINDVGETSSSYYRPGKNTEVSISQRISRISLNNLFFPTFGSRFSLSTIYAGGALGIGTTDYLQNEMNFEMYNPLVTFGESDRVVLYLGTKLGYIAGIETDTAMNPRMLYWMGGNGLVGIVPVTPMRGYEDRSIGPESGGKFLARITSELRFAISLNPMPIYFYGFAEAGNVWSDIGTADPFNLRRSAGVGIQMFMQPLGIIGFSYGYGFDAPRGSVEPSGWRFLFHLGQQ